MGRSNLLLLVAAALAACVVITSADMNPNGNNPNGNNPNGNANNPDSRDGDKSPPGNSGSAPGQMTKASPFACSVLCTNATSNGTNLTASCGSPRFPVPRGQCVLSQNLIARGYNTTGVTVACPAMACDAFCSAEGVNVTANGTFHCYNKTNLMAPTAVQANDKAIALGCFGSHAMGDMFMAGINHSMCAPMEMNHGDGGMKHDDMNNATNATGIKGRPDTTGMKPEDAFEARKDAAEQKKKDAEEKKKVAEELRAAAVAKSGEASNKRREAESKKAEMESKRDAAHKTRDSMLANITDANAKRKAEMLADAAIAGKPIKKVRANFTAANETEACETAYASMKLNASLGVCEVSNATAAGAGRRRRLLADQAYSVSVLLSEAEVDQSTIAAALDALATANISAETVTEDALAVLATVDGIDTATLNILTTEVTAFAAAATAAAEADTAAIALEAAASAAETDAAALETEANTLASEATTLEQEAADAAARVPPPPVPSPPPKMSPPAPSPVLDDKKLDGGDKNTAAAGSFSSTARAVATVVAAALALFLTA